MPTSPSARARSSHGRGSRPHVTPTPATENAVPSPSLAFTGLASVLLGVPLAVLGSATGPYDDPKAWALSILVALSALAWIAGAGRRRAPDAVAPEGGTSVVRGLVLTSVAWSLIVTMASVAPAQSILGTFGRGMGMLTLGFAALWFFFTHSECRTPRGVRALVDMALLGSVPVCLMALAQVAGWDPLPGAWDPAVRTLTVRSTFGTHVFLGSYLVVLIPLTLARLEWAFRERLPSGRWPRSGPVQWGRIVTATVWVAGAVVLIGQGSHWPVLWWALVPWGVVGAMALRLGATAAASDTAQTVGLLAALLLGQVLVVVLSRGRGAFIAMLVGVGVTVFALLIRRRAWKTLAVAALGSMAMLAFLVLLNVPRSPIARLGKLPLLSRLGDITNVRHGSPGWVRIQLWRGIADGWRRQLAGDSVIPEVSPRLRGLIGYGPETQLIVLEPLTAPFAGKLSASGVGWQARYVFDRAHNALLDRLITEGVVGVGLWLSLLAGLVVVGIARLRASPSVGETTIRVGALGAVLAHVADGQVGMATPMSLVLFWMAAALLTSEPWARDATPGELSREPTSTTGGWIALLIGVALVTSLIAWAGTRWLLASMAYADGVRRGIAGQLSDAYGEFKRAVVLAPWLPLPAESAAYTALRLATGERDLSRRVALLHEAEALVRHARSHAIGGPGSWALTAQIAFAEARAGEPGQLAVSREAFATALRLRPEDPRLLAQSAWVWLESGDARKARQTAEQALTREPREWLAWAVLARVSRTLGDTAAADQAASRARDLAPLDARPLLDNLLR